MLFEPQKTSLKRERKGDSSTRSKSEYEKRTHGHRHGQTSEGRKHSGAFLSDLSKSFTRDVTCRKSKTLILETNLEIEFNQS